MCVCVCVFVCVATALPVHTHVRISVGVMSWRLLLCRRVSLSGLDPVIPDASGILHGWRDHKAEDHRLWLEPELGGWRV